MKPVWLNTDNVKWLVGTLAIPATLGLLTFFYNVAAADRSESESRLRLYTELVNKREEADTNVRRDIFSKLMEKYLDPGQADLDRRMVALELLSQNFSESLNLSPLFWQLNRQIDADPRVDRDDMHGQLQRIAFDVRQSQLDILRVYGQLRSFPAPRDDETSTGFERDFVLGVPGTRGGDRRIGCHFTIEATAYDAAKGRVLVRVQSRPLDPKDHPGERVRSGPGCGDPADPSQTRQWMFWVDQFDFPLVTFTRMSTEERFTVFFDQYEKSGAQLTFMYFPSSLSGVRDKPFIDDVMANLRDPKR